MKYLTEKLKALSTGLLAIAFIVAFTMSCSTGTKDADGADEAETTEQTTTEEASEHPTEHPSADDTEEADSTVVESDTTATE